MQYLNFKKNKPSLLFLILIQQGCSESEFCNLGCLSREVMWTPFAGIKCLMPSLYQVQYMAYTEKSHQEMFIFTPFQFWRSSWNKLVTSVVGHGSSVGWHQGLPQPSSGLLLCLSVRVWLHAAVKGKYRWKNSKPLSLSVRSPFPLFFLYWVSLLSLIKQGLSLHFEGPSQFSPSSHSFPPQWAVSASVLESCWCLTPLPTAVVWSHTSVLSPTSQSPCRRTQTPMKCPSLELSMLIPSPGHSYLQNNKKNEQICSNTSDEIWFSLCLYSLICVGVFIPLCLYLYQGFYQSGTSRRQNCAN